MYCRLCVWYSLLIVIINNQDLSKNSLMVILNGRHMLTEKPKGYLIEPKSLIRRHISLMKDYVCDTIIWINNIAFRNRNYIWIWIFLHKISFFKYISLYHEPEFWHSFCIWHYITLIKITAYVCSPCNLSMSVFARL